MTFYVATGGDDAAAGTEAAPWATLAHAFDVVARGDRVLVGAGTYAGATLSRHGVVVRAAGDAVIAGHLVVVGNGNRVIGMKVVGTDSQFDDRGARNRFIDCVATGSTVSGFRCRGRRGSLVRCVSTDHFSAATEGKDEDGFIFDDEALFYTVDRCEAYDNADDGFDTWGARHTVFIECVANRNGFSELGTGDGFKAGRGIGYQAFGTYLRCEARDNKRRGFNTNGGGGNTFTECLAEGNPTSFRSYDAELNLGVRLNRFIRNVAVDGALSLEGTVVRVGNSFD